MKKSPCNYSFTKLKTNIEQIHKYSVMEDDNSTMENQTKINKKNKNVSQKQTPIKTNIVTELIFFSKVREDGEKENIQKFELENLNDALYIGMEIIVVMAKINNKEYIYKLINPQTGKLIYKNYEVISEIERCELRDKWLYNLWMYLFFFLPGEFKKVIKIFLVYTVLASTLLIISGFSLFTAVITAVIVYSGIILITYLNVSKYKRNVESVIKELDSIENQP